VRRLLQSPLVKERIQKVLASAGVASRRNIERMIREGRVALNGNIVVKLPALVDPQADRVEVDEDLVRLAPDRGEKRMYILLNKPKHVYSTNIAQGEQTRAIDLLPPNLPGRVYPVGRLDAETKGLLLLTNDGDMTHRLTHPRYGVTKTYRAVVDGYITPKTMETFSRGVWLTDGGVKREGKRSRSHVKVVKRGRDVTVLDITIREGRNSQVRRMLAKLGHKVRDLTRVGMGPLSLQGLSVGQFRNLTGKEVAQLRAVSRDHGDGDSATT
jgi:23S rRNA pseudouridine2605 synthase